MNSKFDPLTKPPSRYLHSFFMPISMHFLSLQAWHCLLLFFVMLHWLLYEHVKLFEFFMLRLRVNRDYDDSTRTTALGVDDPNSTFVTRAAAAAANNQRASTEDYSCTRSGRRTAAIENFIRPSMRDQTLSGTSFARAANNGLWNRSARSVARSRRKQGQKGRA